MMRFGYTVVDVSALMDADAVSADAMSADAMSADALLMRSRRNQCEKGCAMMLPNGNRWDRCGSEKSEEAPDVGCRMTSDAKVRNTPDAGTEGGAL